MAKQFSTHDAKDMFDIHQGIKKNMRYILSLDQEYQSNIISAANQILDKEVIKLLQGVPVEELTRDKQCTIKPKFLHDNGFDTIGDLLKTSAVVLEDINGISRDGSLQIRRFVDEMIAQTRKTLKIRLSADNRTEEATLLVSLLSKYKDSISYLKTMQQLEYVYGSQIDSALVDLKPATNGFVWLFTSKADKQKAINAFDTLGDQLVGSYGKGVKAAATVLTDIQRRGSDAVWQDFENNSIQFFTLLEDLVPGIMGSDDAVYGLPEDLAKEIREEALEPAGLNCTLRRYQEWGVKYILHQERVLLGDEMGLGKTIQAIAAMVSLKNTGATHFMVVCPASVLANWCREIEKMSTLSVVKVHGADKESAKNRWLNKGGVAVTTYETSSIFFFASDYEYDMITVDEAHYIKNPRAQRTQNVKRMCQHAKRLLFMTGTVLENRVDEMIELIDILRPDITSKVRKMAYMSSAPQFREMVAPVYYRRKREDVLTELPDLIENQEWCILSPEEETIYEKTLMEKNYAAIRRVSWNVDDVQKSSKAMRLREIVENAAEDNRKVIVFSFFLDTVAKVCELLGDICMPPINGSVPPQRRQEIIDEFDKAPAGTVLTAQIQSGGTGLNIQSASVVVLCEPQFKPSIENQAISRAYRMGQARNVLVYRLLCDNTVDDRIMEILADKQIIFDTFADQSVSGQESLELDETTFGDIINEEIERIQAKRLAENSEPR